MCMQKEGKSHRRSRAHPPSCSFEKALPCQAAECRAALPCGLGLYPAKSGHRADIAAAAYWVSNNLKWHSPPFFTSKSVARQFWIAGFHHCSSVFYVLKIPTGAIDKNQQLLIVLRFGKNIGVFTKTHFPPPDKILLRTLNLTHHGFAICQTAR
jgi:hypothetical protein